MRDLEAEDKLCLFFFNSKTIENMPIRVYVRESKSIFNLNIALFLYAPVNARKDPHVKSLLSFSSSALVLKCGQPYNKTASTEFSVFV